MDSGEAGERMNISQGAPPATMTTTTALLPQPAPKRTRYPVAPKAQGALLGGGLGGALAAILVQILQTDVTHGPLADPWVQLIYLAVPAAVAFVAAYAAPHQSRPYR